MRRALEKFFRYWAQILALLLIPIVVALAIAWKQPPQYEASATLWALQRYSIIGATGPESDLTSTPATTQSTAVSELLQSRTFDLAIAKNTNLASTFDAATRADPNKLDQAIVQELSTKVTTTAVGYNLYQIVYDNKDPKIAQQVVTAIVDQFGVTATGYSIVEAKQLIQAYQAQLGPAQQSAFQASQVAANYLASHPLAATRGDPTYSLFLQQELGAQANANTIQSDITQLNLQLANIAGGQSGLYRIIDSPKVSSQPVSPAKTLALGGGIGAGVGLLAAILFFVMVMRRDRSPYSVDDLSRFTELPVALELPLLQPALVGAAVKIHPALLERVNTLDQVEAPVHVEASAHTEAPEDAEAPEHAEVLEAFGA